MNILFVCTGNTCRSPMAEGIAKAILAKKGKDDVVLSAGLFTAPGGRVSPFAVEAVKDIADISEHRSRPLTTALIDAADLVVGSAVIISRYSLVSILSWLISLLRLANGPVPMKMCRILLVAIKRNI